MLLAGLERGVQHFDATRIDLGQAVLPLHHVQRCTLLRRLFREQEACGRAVERNIVVLHGLSLCEVGALWAAARG